MQHAALYDDLGVPPSAHAKVIKAAYRKLAQRLHPDREGGDAEAFTRVQTAYDVLSDPDRRKKYDETGDTRVPDHDMEMLQELAQLFFAVVEGCPDPARLDIVKEVRGHLDAAGHGAAQEIGKWEAKKRKVEDAQKRLSRKGAGRDVLGDMLGASLTDIARGIEGCSIKSGKIARMREILESYTYRTEAPLPGQDNAMAMLHRYSNVPWGQR